MFNKNKEKLAIINDNIDYLFMNNARRATEIKNLTSKIEKVEKHLSSLRDLSIISSELDSNRISNVDKKYKSVFTLLLNELKLDLDLDEENRMCLKKRGTTNNKTKKKAVKVDKKNSSVRSKTNRKRK